MMGAVAAAARAGGARTVGVIPRSLVGRESADDGVDELLVTDTMRERKALMEAHADAFLDPPGRDRHVRGALRGLDRGLRSGCTTSRSCCSTRTATTTAFCAGCAGWARAVSCTATRLPRVTVVHDVDAALDACAPASLSG